MPIEQMQTDNIEYNRLPIQNQQYRQIEYNRLPIQNEKSRQIEYNKLPNLTYNTPVAQAKHQQKKSNIKSTGGTYGN